jgi:hypothetical protein
MTNAVDERRAPLEGDAERRAVFHGADRRAPEDFSCLQVDRDQGAPRRLVAGQAELRERHHAHHRKRRADLRSEIDARGRLESFRFRARDQLDEMHGVAGIGVKDLVHRIERRAAPVHAAAGHREDDRALRRGRRVEPVIAQARKLRFAGRAADDRRELELVS